MSAMGRAVRTTDEGRSKRRRRGLLDMGRMRRRKRSTKTSEEDKISRAVSVKQELQKLVVAVRNKFKELRRSADEAQESLEVGARPFVEPLRKAVAESIRSFMPIKKEEEEEEKEEVSVLEKKKKSMTPSTPKEKTFGLVTNYLNRLSNPLYKDKLDFIYGVRPDGRGGTLIGDSTIRFTTSKISVKNRVFDVTVGLMELLFMKTPERLMFDREDLTQYKDILVLTNAHRQSYSAEKQINANRGRKYTSVISPLFFPKSTDREQSFQGSGIQFTSYNNNVNKLVNRLRLLVLSQSAGYSGHEEEIKQIIATLRCNEIIT